MKTKRNIFLVLAVVMGSAILASLSFAESTPDWSTFFATSTVHGNVTIKRVLETNSLTPSATKKGDVVVVPHKSESTLTGEFASSPTDSWVLVKDSPSSFKATLGKYCLTGSVHEADYSQHEGGIYSFEGSSGEFCGTPSGVLFARHTYNWDAKSWPEVLQSFQWKDAGTVGVISKWTGSKPKSTAEVEIDTTSNRIVKLNVSTDSTVVGAFEKWSVEFKYDPKSKIDFPISWKMHFKFVTTLGGTPAQELKTSDDLEYSVENVEIVDKLTKIPIPDGYVFWKPGNAPPSLVYKNGEVTEVNESPSNEKPGEPKAALVVGGVSALPILMGLGVVILRRRKD